jgi:predicted small secreted protein
MEGGVMGRIMLLAIALVLLASLVLAGCGGGANY